MSRLQPTLNASCSTPNQQASSQAHTLDGEKGTIYSNNHFANAYAAGGLPTPPAATYHPPSNEEQNILTQSY